MNIEELGYIKRLQYGIKELRAGHPEWCGSNTDTVTRVSTHTCVNNVYSTVRHVCFNAASIFSKCVTIFYCHEVRVNLYSFTVFTRYCRLVLIAGAKNCFTESNMYM